MEIPGTGPDSLLRMDGLAATWQATSDARGTFLACYRVMTTSMINAADGFTDPVWVDHLLVRFADHYFTALDAYDLDPATAPATWRIAHDSCQQECWDLQRLLLGINAHINVDLPLTVEELLAPEWATLSDAERDSRRRDYLSVNDIISATVDAVQDTVVEPAVPFLALVDVLFGPADEFVMSHLLGRWRERAWVNAVALMEAPDAETRAEVYARMEEDAVATAHGILITHGRADWDADRTRDRGSHG